MLTIPLLPLLCPILSMQPVPHRGSKRIALLGDMLELGKMEPEAHMCGTVVLLLLLIIIIISSSMIMIIMLYNGNYSATPLCRCNKRSSTSCPGS